MKVYYKKELNPNYWKDGKFDPSIREKLIQIAKDLYEPLNIEPDDITLTGSLAGYAYTKYSDLDLHILLDFSKINKDVDLVRQALDGKRFAWNIKHNIIIKGHEVELYFQDSNDPHHALSVYSLLNNEWIKPPKYDPPTIDWDDVNFKASAFANFIQRMSETLKEIESPEEFEEINNKAKSLLKKIMNFRKEGLQKDGEFSVENLVFKKLRWTESIEKLMDIINTSYDNIFSENVSFQKFHKELAKYIK
jgi:hypothetical protein